MPGHPGRRRRGACLAVALWPLLLLLRCLAVDGCVEGGPLPEKIALLRLRSSFRDPFGILFSWNPSDSDPCSWFGVSCDARRCVAAVRITGGRSGQPSSFVSVPRGRGPKLAGLLSASIANLTELRVLSLAFNEISGLIPPEICRLSRLEVLDLSYNRFLGPIPSGISGCRELRYLNLGGNRLDGTIPASLGYLPRLQRLSLEFNRLSGSIPAKLCQNSSYLEQLQLASNKLSGRIPAVLGNCRNLRSLFLFSNSFKGSIPPELAGLSDLEILDVSRNSLSGPIPPEFGSLKNLQFFSMAYNNITGEIPANLALFTSVKVPSLLKNGLSGEIRSKLRRLTFPLLDENNLSGRIRSGSAKPRTLLQDTSSKRYASAPPPPSTSPQVNNGFTSIEIAAITSSSAIVSVLIALLLLLLYTRRSVGRSAVAQGPPIKAEVVTFCNIGVKITFGDVARGTGGFNPSNCIGHGGFGATYKAEISPGLLVAIKRLSVGRFQQGARQFEAEIRTLGKIQHPNLVTLIGFHSSEAEMFLIYNYLPGGNLEKFIQERSKRPADWRMLHKIALDVAGALAYLHYVCVPRVLHRDIKPSNILLDNNFTAYLSDFGLARLLGASETHATTEVAGTFGYVAPEYAMTSRVSDKADVYSYGVVLLELMSDKKALDPSFSSYGNGFNIVGWAAMLLGQGRACEFFAAGLWEAAPHRDLVETLHLAVRCTDDSLTIRPTMKRVVQRLKELQPSPC